MPCKDTTALMTVRIDHQDRLLSYDYAKISCDKVIGNGQSFQQYSEEKSIQEILGWDFPDILEALQLQDEDTESQFLVFLEWSALRSALIQYSGGNEDVNAAHFEVASVEYSDQEVQIIQVIRPYADMPKIQSCFQRSRQIPG